MLLRALFSLPILTCLSVAVPAASAEEYRIGPEDLLDVQVWSRPDLSGQIRVETTGEIRLPLLGPVPAVERTPEELGEDLMRRYAILDARVSEVLVSIVEYRSRSVTVVGEVKTPGRVSFRDIPNLWEILLTSGGPTVQADLSTVQIVRKDRVEGEEQTVTVDLSAGLDKTDLDALPEVRPRDTIVVPSLIGESATGESFQVIGAVARPGVYKLSNATTVIEALAISGGPTPTADLRKVSLTRPTQDGVAAFALDLDGHLKRGLPLADLPLKEGDTISIPVKGGVDATTLISRIVGLATVVTAVSSLVVALQ